MKLYTLEPEDYERARPLFKGLECHLIVEAVMQGTSPGRVYVDDVRRPASALLCSAEGTYLGGSPDNQGFNAALGRLFAEWILSGDAARPDDDQIDLRFAPGTWEDKLAVLFGDRPPFQEHRRHYICRAPTVDWQGRIPAGFTVRRIDEALLRMSGSQSPDSALDRYALTKIETHWGSIPVFVQKGVGFCALHGERVVCWCIGDCVTRNACEVGIRTHPDYRRRGLATLTVAATVDDCLSRGLAPVGWHCWENNAGSIGVAEKVGFELECAYVSYVCIFDEVRHLAGTGLARFLAGQLEQSADSFARAFALDTGLIPYQYYHYAARASAALGDVRLAFEYLHAAADRGWNQIELATDCQEFESLHATAEWELLLARLGGSGPR